MNVAVTTAAEGFPRRVFTVEDISRMIEAGVIREDEKFELIEGEIVMTAAKGVAHERIKSALTVAVSRALPDFLTIGVEATLRLTDTIMLEPDVAVFPKKGMARALVATALAQALVAVIAIFAGLGLPWSGPLELLVLNGFFAALWLLSAWLFRKAAPVVGKLRQSIVVGRWP